MYIYSKVKNSRLYVESSAPIDTYRIYDKDGNEFQCPKLSCEQTGDIYVTELDASELQEYTVGALIYRFDVNGEVVFFGFTDNRAMNDEIQGRKFQREKSAVPYIYSNVKADLLYVETVSPIDTYKFTDADGNAVDCPKLTCKQKGDVYVTTFDASQLKAWSVNTPVLYTIEVDGHSIRFGHNSIATHRKEILLNDKPIYIRGYIRGIVAHDHPNMTGLSDYEAAVKNIKQAKKYGFNLVRFHTTIPSDDFVRAADELGMLIQMETGYVYERIYNPQTGRKEKFIRSFGETLWEDTICKFRNHPSVAIFCIGNEMRRSGRYPEVHEMIGKGREMAPTKLFMDNCGWGEYDRDSTDVYVQHMGYYMAYAHHKNMFATDFPWTEDGSTSCEPIKVTAKEGEQGQDIRRYCYPLKPVLAHESMHYIDIPDYAALEKKFDDFCEKVGPEYLKKHEIKKPKYFAGLQKLIEQRGIQDLMPDYIAASRKTKLLNMKLYLEQLRQTDRLTGYEMLQLSDCLKYENKNGILDFFDDDKYIDPKWMLQMNDEIVLLADFAKDRVFEDEELQVDIFVSNYLEQPRLNGTLEVTLDGEVIYMGRDFVMRGGLQELIRLKTKAKASGKPQAHILAARLVSPEREITNSWKFWTYPHIRPDCVPEMELANEELAAYLAKGTKKSDLYVTDTLNQNVLDKLAEGRKVMLLYQYKAERNQWDLWGAMERFKPCIWDRGHNLGGIINNPTVEAALGDDRYFDRNMQPLLDVGSKVNLDNWPWKVTEHVLGVDKPVRDRYKAMQEGIKEFVPNTTLRRFTHLFSVKVGAGTLIVCTFNLDNPEDPVKTNFLKVLFDQTDVLDTDCSVDAAEFKALLEKIKEEGLRPEDYMNSVWQEDRRFVERVLFWEDLNVNLAAIK